MVKVARGNSTFSLESSLLRKSPYFNSFIERWSKGGEIEVPSDFEDIFPIYLKKLRNPAYLPSQEYWDDFAQAVDYFGLKVSRVLKFKTVQVTSKDKVRLPPGAKIEALYGPKEALKFSI